MKPGSGRFPWRRKGQPTPVFLPGKSRGSRGAWWATVHGAAKSWTRLSNWTTTNAAKGNFADVIRVKDLQLVR